MKNILKRQNMSLHRTWRGKTRNRTIVTRNAKDNQIMRNCLKEVQMEQRRMKKAVQWKSSKKTQKRKMTGTHAQKRRVKKMRGQLIHPVKIPSIIPAVCCAKTSYWKCLRLLIMDPGVKTDN